MKSTFNAVVVEMGTDFDFDKEVEELTIKLRYGNVEALQKFGSAVLESKPVKITIE